ncbi:unnamed protein product, partial [marine sediment metagenome]
ISICNRILEDLESSRKIVLRDKVSIEPIIGSGRDIDSVPVDLPKLVQGIQEAIEQAEDTITMFKEIKASLSQHSTNALGYLALGIMALALPVLALAVAYLWPQILFFAPAAADRALADGVQWAAAFTISRAHFNNGQGRGASSKSRDHRLVGEAKQALGRRDWPAAIQKAREAIEINERNAYGWTILTKALLKAGQTTEAVSNARETVKRFPNNVVARNTLSNALLQAGQPQEAVSNARETAKRFPNDAFARTTLSNALLQAGQSQEAVVNARETAKRFPDNAFA